MNTTPEAIKLLQEALQTTQKATTTIDNLVADHDYQDVAAMVARAAAALLSAATDLMQANDTQALTRVEEAEDLLDEFFDTIDADLDA